MTLSRKLFRWLPALLMMAAIFIFSSIPSKEMPDFGLWDLLVKKGAHALEYGLLALSFHYGLSGGNRGQNRISLYLLAWALAAMYAATDEFHQSFVPGRHPAASDVLVDACGAALVLALWFWRSRRQKQTSEKQPASHS